VSHWNAAPAGASASQPRVSFFPPSLPSAPLFCSSAVVSAPVLLGDWPATERRPKKSSRAKSNGRKRKGQQQPPPPHSIAHLFSKHERYGQPTHIRMDTAHACPRRRPTAPRALPLRWRAHTRRGHMRPLREQTGTKEGRRATQRMMRALGMAHHMRVCAVVPAPAQHASRCASSALRSPPPLWAIRNATHSNPSCSLRIVTVCMMCVRLSFRSLTRMPTCTRD
jgi:hypothetical protein